MRIRNTYSIAPHDVSGNGVNMMFVLVEDEMGMFAVYMGTWIPPKSNARDDKYGDARLRAAEEIARLGQKMTYRQAIGFYFMPEEKYRA